MAAHRYWRFVCDAIATGGNVFSIMEITAATAVGGANQLTGSTASASSTVGGWPASQAIDGNPNTGWAATSNTPGEWIAFDLGAGNDKDLSGEISLLSRNDGSANQSPVSGRWQWSDDNVNWTTALSYVYSGNIAQGMTNFVPTLTGTFLDSYGKQNTNVAVSARNLVATFTGSVGIRANRDIRGLVYFEGTITALAGTPQIGVAQSNWDNNTALGTGANTVGYQPSGAVRINNATVQTIAAYAVGNRIGVAVDPIKKLIWFRVNGGNWNNSGTADPATGAGGIDISGMTPGTLFPAISATLTGTTWTMAFNTFTDAAPAGFVAADAVNFTPNAVLGSAEPIAPGSAQPAPNVTVNPQYDANRYFTPAGPVTKVSGIAEESGVPVAGRLIEAFDRVSGDRLDWTLSKPDGTWELVALGRPSVRVVGSDPTTYNSLVYDNVVPV